MARITYPPPGTKGNEMMEYACHGCQDSCELICGATPTFCPRGFSQKYVGQLYERNCYTDKPPGGQPCMWVPVDDTEEGDNGTP